jgi:hypothetical protein
LTMLVLAGAIGAGAYAWSIVAKDPGIPPAPPAPKRNVGQVPPPKPVPSDDEMKLILGPVAKGGG